MDSAQIEKIIFADSDDIVRCILFAIEDLAREESCELKDITVNRVCERANVSRATFYRHFKGVEGAVIWHMERSVTMGMGNVGRLLTWPESFQVTLECAYYLRDTVSMFGRANLSSVFTQERGFEDVYYSLLVETITQYKHVELTEELEFIVRSWVLLLSGQLNLWRLEGYKLPIPQFIEYLQECIPSKLYELLKEPISRG